MGIRETVARLFAADRGQPVEVKRLFGGDFGSSFIESIFQGQSEFLGAYASVGWLHAVADKIAMGVSSAHWHLYKGTGKKRKEVMDHPCTLR